MSQKSSLPQAAKSVSQVLMSDTPWHAPWRCGPRAARRSMPMWAGIVCVFTRSTGRQQTNSPRKSQDRPAIRRDRRVATQSERVGRGFGSRSGGRPQKNPTADRGVLSTLCFASTRGERSRDSQNGHATLAIAYITMTADSGSRALAHR